MLSYTLKKLQKICKQCGKKFCYRSNPNDINPEFYFSAGYCSIDCLENSPQCLSSNDLNHLCDKLSEYLGKDTINIALDFHRSPAGRYETDGEFSGELFREKFLVPAFRNKNNSQIEVILDGLDGIGSSFWEEAFVCLTTKCGIAIEEIRERLVLVCSDNITLVPLIKGLMESEH